MAIFSYDGLNNTLSWDVPPYELCKVEISLTNAPESYVQIYEGASSSCNYNLPQAGAYAKVKIKPAGGGWGAWTEPEFLSM